MKNGVKIVIQIVILLVAVAAVYGVTHKFVLAPQREQLEKQQRDVTDLRRKNDATDRFRLERDALQRESEAAQARYQKVEGWLLKASNTASVLTGVKDAARKNGLQVRVFDNTHPPYVQGINESPLKIHLGGRFQGQLEFLRALAFYPQIILIRTQKLESLPAQSTIVMELSAATPIDLPTKEAVAEANAVVAK